MKSWEKVILSWVNVCGVCSEPIVKLEDLFDGKLLDCFLTLSLTKDDPENPFPKLLKFIQRCYPHFWAQTLSDFPDEEVLILYSVLVHFHSFSDDSVIRNKMCSLDNASQVQIKNFLECLMNKDVTKDAIVMAIKSCCETATAESPVEVYESTPQPRRGKSKTALQDFWNTPAAERYSRAEQKRHSEIKKLELELQTERDAHLLYKHKFEEMKKEKDRMETKKDEDIKKLQAKLCERHVQIEDDFVKQTNAYSTDQHLKIIELRGVIKCLDEKCANFIDENCKLSEKVKSLEYQLSNSKLRSLTFEKNYYVLLEEESQKISELEDKVKSLVSDIRLKERLIKDLGNELEEKLLHEQPNELKVPDIIVESDPPTEEDAPPLGRSVSFPKDWDEYANLPVLPVTCKDTTAELHKFKLGSGSRGKCIKLADTWYTPTQFEAECGMGTNKHWKRSIRFGDHILQDLIDEDVLRVHSRSCECSVCCDDESATGRIRLTPSKVHQRTSDGEGSSSRKKRS